MIKKQKKRALLAADTDRTLDYVFESARLPEIRGASTILNDLNCRTVPASIERTDRSAELIYAGGGSLLYEVDAALAPQIQQELEALYPRETGVATITCVYRELPADPDRGIPSISPDEAVKAHLTDYQRQRLEREDQDLGCFGAWVRLLGQDLRRRKQEKVRAPFIESMPYAKRCCSCRMRPAEDIKLDYEEERPLCRECSKKKDNNDRSPWRDEFEEKLRECYPKLAETYFAEAKGKKVQMPRDINMIAKASHPRNHNKQNYVAFIYADGDGVGAFVESQRTREDYTEMSKMIDAATLHAVTYALGKNLPVQVLGDALQKEAETADECSKPTQPFEIITVGGDDIMLIVPAHAALPVAKDMSAEFSRFLCNDYQRSLPDNCQRSLRDDYKINNLTLSVGVVIAPAHMPVRLMRDFALEALKKGAKQRARKTGTAAVDFQVFTSASVMGADLMAVRKHPPYTLVPPNDPTGKPLHLYHRPYTLPELEGLLGALEVLNQTDFPASQLYALAAALERGRQWSTLFYLYQRSRLRKKHREALANVETIIVPPQPRKDPLPWYRPSEADAPYAFSTLLLDVAELYDFVPDVEKEDQP